MLIVSTFSNKDIFAANFEQKSRYVRVHLVRTLSIKKKYASYLYLPNHKIDIPKQSFTLK